MDLLFLVGAGFGLIVIGRLVYTSRPASDAPFRGRLHRWCRRLLFFLSVLVTVGFTAYWGYLQHIAAQEAASPSTSRFLVLAGGRQIPLTRPDSERPVEAAATDALVAPENRAATPPPAAFLPPTRLRIPEIELDARVVLAAVEALPEARVVAWIDGSAFPGAAGNMVLYGYQTGPYKTFLHLGELAAGSEIRVLTGGPEPREIVYRVRTISIASADDVVLLAPTSSPIATLITDVPGAPGKRLAVIADVVP